MAEQPDGVDHASDKGGNGSAHGTAGPLPAANGTAHPPQGEPAHPANGTPDRETMPIEAEQPPRLPFTVVGIGASAGGLEALSEFFDAARSDTGMAFVVVQHLPPQRESMMADILAKHTGMPVLQVEDGQVVRPNHVYVIRPGHTLTIRFGKLHLGEPLEKRGHQRPVDDFFRSLAEEQRERSVCVILSGMGSNGTAGAQMVKAVGGVCVAQEPETAKYPSMPRALIDAGWADFILPAGDIPETLARFAGTAYVRGGSRPADTVARRDQKHLDEILGVLRTRTRHDFAGYKKPTIVRRVQRRMGLNHVSQLADYARLLRQTPAEATALTDDLLIHVTGFFRDPEAWESLRREVVAPLVARKLHGDGIRCWVSACSSGEEAYTLGMVLAEEAERAGKQFDVKIFATDMAERSLAHARAGVFPGGIESEMPPERLARFFDRDDANYRIKRVVREMVVFAPQNVLQDPPFSRMDVCTCRNLLIYLEPEVQRKVLLLLHFGLVDGGVLFLGTSETLGATEDLFEAVDKRHRIYRRVGATRHGSVDFPLPTRAALSLATSLATSLARDAGEGEFRPAKTTVAQLTQRALLERYTPASVVVDRSYNIVYYHGTTEPFLDQPRGEPTRDVMVLARQSVRGAIRTALHAAVERGEEGHARDGTIRHDDGTVRRIVVRAVPLGAKSTGNLFLVSFDEVPEPIGADLPPGTPVPPDAALQLELNRVRDDLQVTIDALQATNEEMKAANEEVTSINEELQSTNEELETSKEELQSLNEELSTVNAQLQAKMAELQLTTNDLTSLLSSTDLAVVFLDPQFRIRRFTPAVKDLLDLISSDVGRPLRDMARKFEDPDLMPDAAAVLKRLVPIEREVVSGSGRWYARRVTPYRTVDDRIDGVVLTFHDVTATRETDAALRASEERYRALVNASSYAVYRMSADWTEMRDLDGRGFLADTAEPSRSWTDVYIPAEDQPRVWETIRAAIRDRDAFQLEHRIRRADGTVGWTASRAVPVTNGRGEIVEWFGAATDVTGRRQATEAQRESEVRLRTITDLVPDLLWHDDAAGRTDWYNARWLEYTGQAAAERAGGAEAGGAAGAGAGWLDAIHPQDRDRSAANLRRAVGAGDAVRQECRVRRADGQYRWFLVQAMPLRAADGTVREWYGAATDVHDQRTAMDQARATAERMRLTVQATRLGFWEWLVATDRVQSEPQHNRNVGLPAGTTEGSMATFAATVHPDDHARVMAELTAATTRRADFEIEFRVVWPDSSVRWVAKYGHPIFADDGGGDRADDRAGGTNATARAARAERAERVVGTTLDVTERKQAEAERDARLAAEREARQAAEAANEAKDQFLANVSHELRTPLSAILLWSKQLRLATISDKQRAEGLDAISVSAESQRELIEDLLDTGRIVAGKLRLDVRTFDLPTLVREAVDGVRPAAEARRVNLTVNIGPKVDGVEADPDRLRQVLWNLLSNAVKFTPADGRVDVDVQRQADEVDLVVGDTGRGIPAGQLPHVFERFWQADAAAPSSKGLGLGLAISKQLVELHGGTIDVASDGPGRGTTFRVRLPLPSLAPDARPPARRRPAAAAAAAAAPPRLADTRLLLVEDDDATREALRVVLETAGAEVTAVATVADALAAYKAQEPDLILSDIGLPDGDGNDLIRQIRTNEAARKAAATPAVALTAMVRRQDRRRSAESGFQQHLAKPVDPDQLVRTLGGLVER